METTSEKNEEKRRERARRMPSPRKRKRELRMKTSEKKKKKLKTENRDTEIHIPWDVALIIASYLPERDVCALGSCSKYWRQVCRSDSIWRSLYLKRWPSRFKTLHPSQLQDWLERYLERIRSMEIAIVRMEFAGIHTTSEFHKQYKVAQKKLTSIRFCFADVERFFFDPRLNKYICLLGIIYSINHLDVSREDVVATLIRSGICYRRAFGSVKQLLLDA